MARLISVLLNTSVPGVVNFSTPVNVGCGDSRVCVTTIADFDRDGALDLAIRGNGSDVHIFSNNTAASSSTLAFAEVAGFSESGNSGFIAIADVNGDAKPDLVSANGGEKRSSVCSKSLLCSKHLCL